MTGNVIKLPSALRDLDSAADHIRRKSGPDRAIRFLREAGSTFTRLAGMPGIGMRYDSEDRFLADIRVFPISRHKKYLVFYRIIEEGIEVVRVLHGARDIHGVLSEEFGGAEEADENETGEDD